MMYCCKCVLMKWESGLSALSRSFVFITIEIEGCTLGEEVPLVVPQNALALVEVDLRQTARQTDPRHGERESAARRTLDKTCDRGRAGQSRSRFDSK